MADWNCNLCKEYQSGIACTYCDDGSEFVRMSNADRIRAMDDEELAELLEKIVSGNRDVIGINCGNSKCDSWKCTECISMWLKSEAE